MTETRMKSVGFFDYRGIDSKGLARTGRQDGGSAETLIRQKYDQGWRSLTVWRSDFPSNGRIGEICTDLDSGNRTWWAEK